MAIARNTNAAAIKPVTRQCVIIRGTVGATVEAGEAVTLQSDGFWDPAIATAVVKNAGLAVKGGAVGDEIDIVIMGEVECVTGATPGAIVYVSDTAGEPAEAAGTKSFVLGYAKSATALIIMPQTVAFS